MTIKFTFFFYLLLAIIPYAKGQDVAVDWLKLYKGTGKWIDRDRNDNVYTASSNLIILLNKRDKFGNLLWQRSFTTDTIFNYETPTRVHLDSSGNIIVVGYRYTSSVENGQRANALIVLKYSANGNLLWQQIIEGYFSAFIRQGEPQRYHNSVTSVLDTKNNVYVASGGNVTGKPSGFNTIKISPAGKIVWHRVQSFPNSAFYLVNNIRIKGPILGLAGFNNLTGPTALIWVLDTAGARNWNRSNEGYSGQDIAFDDNYNVYLLSTNYANFYGDVSVYKFKPTGEQIWFRKYDFGDAEITTRMEFSPLDKNLVIIAHGNQFPGGNLYADWLTIKIDKQGNLLWSKRFDKHEENDEIPKMLAINCCGEIYVTGIGGPFPGGSNLGKRQWVTVKYLPTGQMDWFVPIDTLSEYITGVSIALASDASLFVLADVSSVLMRLLDFRETGDCLISSAPHIASKQVDSTSSLQSVALFPNPVSNSLLVVFTSATKSFAEVSITNMQGRTMLRRSENILTGNNKISVDVSRLSRGMYYLKLQVEGETVIQKIIKE